MRPVLICSSDFDVTTNQVIQWLSFYCIPFIRVSESNKLDLYELQLSSRRLSVSIIHKGKIINLESLRSYWYRRGFLNFNWQDGGSQNDSINKICAEERSIVFSFVEEFLLEIGVGAYKHNRLNKLNVLRKAKKCGLKLANTFISSNADYYRKTLTNNWFGPLNTDKLRWLFKNSDFVS
jgi:glutamine phosphoribosylpyrophosphate amidotransferase